jgi:hypothetical protein
MASGRPIFQTTTRSRIAESASLLRRPMQGLAMSRTPKLGRAVARLVSEVGGVVSNMSRALLPGIAGIVEVAQAADYGELLRTSGMPSFPY